MAYTHQNSSKETIDPTTLPPLSLPSGVTSRFVDTSPRGLVFHILESVPPNPSPSTKLIVCIHGFPELAYSWRKILPLLAKEGYHAVAFDQRGYGRTFSRTPLDQTSFRPLNLIRDTITVVQALGYSRVEVLGGHDFGAVAADFCAIARPDMFKSVVLMSHPSKGPPSLPFNISPSYGEASPFPHKEDTMEAELAKLSPPRKHYKWYYCTPPSNDEMTNPTGKPLHDFLRGYFHLKSADWDGNKPHQLHGWIATELEKMPRYYIMDKDGDMRENVRRDMSSEDPEQVSQRASRWLPDNELAVYVDEWSRNSFQGGLNWYRVQTQPVIAADMGTWSGSKVTVPLVFVSGKSDWGTFQEPGAVESMETGKSASDYKGTVIVEGAGHWVNQEQPERCVEEILKMVTHLKDYEYQLLSCPPDEKTHSS